jgi:hypothetical protein
MQYNKDSQNTTTQIFPIISETIHYMDCYDLIKLNETVKYKESSLEL